VNILGTSCLSNGMSDIPCGASKLTRRSYLPRGRIHLIRGNPRTNLEADAIFQLYQIQAASGELPFRRFPLRAVRPMLLIVLAFHR